MYNLIRPLLFLFDPEAVHHATFALLRLAGKIPGVPALMRRLWTVEDPALERELFGLRFRNPVGLAAGFDKDARLIDELSWLGFGFIEIGTVTPLAQPGNPRPRLFRLPADQGIINRMGFNNRGAVEAANYLRGRNTRVIIGGNIGKNKSTPNERAVEDYIYCVEVLYPYVDYFVVNVSSPNTPHLRELQEKEPLKKLLDRVKARVNAKDKPKPVLLKIAPDLSPEQLDDVIEILKETKTDGVIATNTTLSRDDLSSTPEAIALAGDGGLSGKPLARKSTEIVSQLRRALGPHFPIIGVGGILSEDDALEKLKAGADLIQLYTGFVYEGPGFAKRINQRLLRERVK